jgi:hypothetical protein
MFDSNFRLAINYIEDYVALHEHADRYAPAAINAHVTASDGQVGRPGPRIVCHHFGWSRNDL